MIEMLKRFFAYAATDDSSGAQNSHVHDIRVATCALLLEMAHIDETFSKAEMEALLSILKEKFGLSPENAEVLLAEAEQELHNSVDLWQFARLINENYSIEEKIDVIETLWQLVYVDGKLDQHENYLMHKLSNLLRLSHNQLIDVKLKVLHSN